MAELFVPAIKNSPCLKVCGIWRSPVETKPVVSSVPTQGAHHGFLEGQLQNASFLEQAYNSRPWDNEL